MIPKKRVPLDEYHFRLKQSAGNSPRDQLTLPLKDF
jgi:hypothetical protein